MFTLPLEVINIICDYLHYIDIFSVGSTCEHFRDVIDRYNWKEYFLQRLQSQFHKYYLSYNINKKFIQKQSSKLLICSEYAHQRYKKYYSFLLKLDLIQLISEADQNDTNCIDFFHVIDNNREYYCENYSIFYLAKSSAIQPLLRINFFILVHFLKLRGGLLNVIDIKIPLNYVKIIIFQLNVYMMLFWMLY